ncbi:hypothetical protein F3Y22_tig00000541pilonHSYRG00037 [Hibiscus syriacus]|uniref:CCHC-type domain-containing protein n=1 Tax=Hibiscus syriacus TaxID=106335 RepID=A0A6A3D062_HIBSY|nr:hypothetical protein F3Y22_tig00000541pilonHSYRG00037 [Hibiscus syriacus]
MVVTSDGGLELTRIEEAADMEQARPQVELAAAVVYVEVVGELADGMHFHGVSIDCDTTWVRRVLGAVLSRGRASRKTNCPVGTDTPHRVLIPLCKFLALRKIECPMGTDTPLEMNMREFHLVQPPRRMKLDEDVKAMTDRFYMIISDEVNLKKIDETKKEKKKNVGVALKSTRDESDSGEDDDDEEMTLFSKRFRKLIKPNRGRKFERNEGFKNEPNEKDPIICYECKKLGHVKYDCPQLKKNGQSKKKHKAHMATWSDDEGSNEEEQEVENLCLMAIVESSQYLESYGFLLQIDLIGPAVLHHRYGVKIDLHSYARCIEQDCNSKCQNENIDYGVGARTSSLVTLQLHRGYYHERFIDLIGGVGMLARRDLIDLVLVGSVWSCSHGGSNNKAEKELKGRERGAMASRPWHETTQQLVDVVGAMLQIAEAESLEEGTRHLAIEFMECLDRLAFSLGGNTIVPVTSEQLPAYLAAPEWQKHHAALISLAQIAEGCAKVMIKNLE